MPDQHKENDQEGALAKLADKLARAKQRSTYSHNPTKSSPSGIGLGCGSRLILLRVLALVLPLACIWIKFLTQPIS